MHEVHEVQPRVNNEQMESLLTVIKNRNRPPTVLLWAELSLVSKVGNSISICGSLESFARLLRRSMEDYCSDNNHEDNNQRIEQPI